MKHDISAAYLSFLAMPDLQYWLHLAIPLMMKLFFSMLSLALNNSFSKLRFVGFTSISPHKGFYGTGSGSPSGMHGLPLSSALHILTAGPGRSHKLSVECFCETIAIDSAGEESCWLPADTIVQKVI
jgi:hypothetical protein